MIVVSDTSPINYLILIELQDLLPKLFDRILVPEAVHRELQSAAAPDLIKRFLAEAPDWLEVRPSPEIDPALPQLDSGEREAIALVVDWVRLGTPR
jgi:predicted nucleic acid-binding protein